MKYKTISELDLRIENIVKRTVKAYYTDWKHYDRPKYMKCKGSNRWIDKGLLLIVRECGTYLYTIEELSTSDWARTVSTYYGDKAKYYSIDLDKLTINKIDFSAVQDIIRKTA